VFAYEIRPRQRLTVYYHKCLHVKSTPTSQPLTLNPTAVERIWHMQDSQGQILALAFLNNPLNVLSGPLFARKRTQNSELQPPTPGSKPQTQFPLGRSHLWIDGGKVVSNTGLHAIETKSGTVNLAPGCPPTQKALLIWHWISFLNLLGNGHVTCPDMRVRWSLQPSEWHPTL